jgi:D-psicose/D-tagatose/L-ribulose 3-epimerase
MRIGFNLLLWTGHVTTEHDRVFEALKATGYDEVEIPIFEGTPDHYAALGTRLDKLKLKRAGISVIGALANNPVGQEKSQQRGAVDYMTWLLDCTQALGGKMLAGPLHSTIGHFSGNGPTAEENKRMVGFHQEVGDIAKAKKITVVLEALNRFECYMLNTMAQLASHLDAVKHPNVKAMYDTFHANIDEKDPIAAIATIEKHLVHVHLSENDRGTPGRGHIKFGPVFKALKKQGYKGAITIEAFGRALPELAAATRVWRDLFPAPEQVYKEGYKLIRKGWDKA